MKIAFLFLISCALLIQATGAFAASDQKEHLQNSTPAHTRAAGQALSPRRSTLRPHIAGVPANGGHGVVFPNRELPSETTAATGTNSVMKKGLPHREPVDSALPTRPSTAVSPTLPSLGNLRHRGPNPPVIGGPASQSRNRTGEINGTNVRREH